MKTSMEFPLVSVVLLTYNSSRTVREALESINNQTYRKIELIVTDDCSQDNTVSICNSWIAEKKERFHGVKIVTSEKNTGISGNINRGIKEANGEWIKILAGDDMLLNSGINSLVTFILNNPSASIVFGRVEIYGEGKKSHNNFLWHFNEKLTRILDTPAEQNWYLHRSNFVVVIGMMMKKQLWKDVGGYDEEIPLLEDWPMWLRITASGYRLFFTEEVVANYRLSDSTVTSRYVFNYSAYLFRYKYIFRQPRKYKLLRKMTFLKKKSIFSAIVYKILAFDSLRYSVW